MLLKKHPMRRKKQLLSEAECQQIYNLFSQCNCLWQNSYLNGR